MAIRCDATGDHARRNDNPTGDCTTFFRFFNTALSQTFRVLYYAGDSSASTYQNGIMILFGANANRVEVWLRHLTDFAFQQSAGNALAINTWYDCLCRYNTGNNQAGAIRIWPHGSNVDRGGTFVGSAQGAAVSERIEVGNDATPDSHAPSTRFMDWRVWNTQLTDDEGQAERFSSRARRRTNLWGSWSLRNDGFGLIDESGNGRDLTEVGSLTVEDGAPGIRSSLYSPIIVFSGAGGGLTDVSNPIDLRWDTRQRISQAVEALWDLRARTSQDAELRWDQRARVTESVDLRWDVRARISQLTELLWNTHARVQADVDVRWQLLGKITNALELLWDIESELATVSAALDMRWDLRARVAAAADLRWDLRSRISQAFEAVWDTRQRTTQPLEVQWSIRSRVSGATDFRWGARQQQSSALEAVWQILQRVNGPIDLQWRIGELVIETPEHIITIAPIETFAPIAAGDPVFAKVPTLN